MKRIRAHLLFAVAASMVLALTVKPAAPHEWYDPACCSGRDCAAAPVGSVTAVDGGWQIIILAGEHPMVKSNFSTIVPYGDKRVRPSRDQNFHPCISEERHLLCLYVPEAQG